MVDVGDKDVTDRVATAAGQIRMQPATLAAIQGGGIKKGDVLAVAQVAAVMAAKRTWELIPMCHPLLLTGVSVEFDVDRRLRAGELPLWVPDYFLGAPFLANPQTGVLYPPNWLTLWLDVPVAYGWQAFGHALLLTMGSYWFARRALRVGTLAGLVAGLIV